MEEHIYIAENSYCTFESFIFNNKYWDIISIINCLVQYFFEENILSVINHFSKKKCLKNLMFLIKGHMQDITFLLHDQPYYSVDRLCKSIVYVTSFVSYFPCFVSMISSLLDMRTHANFMLFTTMC